MTTHAIPAHRIRTVQATATMQAGQPVVKIDGALFVVVREFGSGKSGYCLDGFHGDRCRWVPCSCDCHQGAS